MALRNFRRDFRRQGKNSIGKFAIFSQVWRIQLFAPRAFADAEHSVLRYNRINDAVGILIEKLTRDSGKSLDDFFIGETEVSERIGCGQIAQVPFPVDQSEEFRVGILVTVENLLVVMVDLDIVGASGT